MENHRSRISARLYYNYIWIFTILIITDKQLTVNCESEHFDLSESVRWGWWWFIFLGSNEKPVVIINIVVLFKKTMFSMQLCEICHVYECFEIGGCGTGGFRICWHARLHPGSGPNELRICWWIGWANSCFNRHYNKPADSLLLKKQLFSIWKMQVLQNQLHFLCLNISDLKRRQLLAMKTSKKHYVLKYKTTGGTGNIDFLYIKFMSC